MWDVKACRCCLAVTGKLEKVNNALKKLYCAVTDLTIVDGDGYPQYFCLECRTHLRKCLAFRRRSRRAHFVMKEIMIVRKQVSYGDIITVNRKKTNLLSSLNFWEPQKSCYIVINQENDTMQKDVMPSLTYSCTYTTNVDIPPEIKEDKVEETVEPPAEIPDTVPDDEPINADDSTNADEPTNADDFMETDDKFEDIDINDVFKGLNVEEEEDTDDFIEPLFEKTEVNREKKKMDLVTKLVNDIPSDSIINTLLNCEIRVLDLEEQKEKIELRKKMEPFVSAFFKCSMCLTVYKNMDELKGHVEYHNGRRNGIQCEVCKNKFFSVEELNIHIARCHMYEYECKCRGIFYSLVDVVKHYTHCPFKYTKQVTMRDRLKEVLKNFTLTALTQEMMKEVLALYPNRAPVKPKKTKKIKNYQCDICGVWLSTMVRMERHMVLKHKYLYTCNECKEVFTTRADAVAHAPLHKSVRSWTCEDCNKTYTKQKSLEYHRMRSHGARVPCNLCGKDCATLRVFYTHQLNKHKYISLNDPRTGDPAHACVDCGIQFMDKKSLNTHVVAAAHSGAEEVQCACRPCRKVFENEEQMEAHFMTCLYAQYPRKCVYCGEILLDGLHYKRHYTNEHPTMQYHYTKQNAICELCGKLVYKPYLAAHIKSHTGAAYECRLCGYSSATAPIHVGHMLRAHAARPYWCALCSRRFQHRGDCKEHILKVHAPAKLFKCECCGREFSFFPHLKQHCMKSHKLVIPNIKTKPVRSNSRIYVYAHMKVEISVLEKDAVEKTEVALLDYLDQKSKVVDYKDYFIFNSDVDEYIAKVQKKKKKKAKNKIQDEHKIKIESDIVVKTSTELENAVKGIEFEMADRKTPKLEIIESLDEVKKTENETVNEIKVQVKEDLSLDQEKPLEVFESDGNQFVMINGELYRIACDGEDEL